MLAACEDVPSLVAAARKVLNRDDLTRQQRREMAETLSTRSAAFESRLRSSPSVTRSRVSKLGTGTTRDEPIRRVSRPVGSGDGSASSQPRPG